MAESGLPRRPVARIPARDPSGFSQSLAVLGRDRRGNIKDNRNTWRNSLHSLQPHASYLNNIPRSKKYPYTPVPSKNIKKHFPVILGDNLGEIASLYRAKLYKAAK